jgi:hypothetical protein
MKRFFQWDHDMDTERTVWNDPIKFARMNIQSSVNHYGSQEYARVRATESASTELGSSRGLAGCRLGWNGFGFRGRLDFGIPRSIAATLPYFEKRQRITARFTNQLRISPDAGLALILPA